MTSPSVIILGADEPHFGSEPSAIQRTSSNRRALDWIIGSFRSTFEDPELHFVGGYRFKDVIEEYPNVHFSRNEDWKSTGTVGSLLAAPLSEEAPLYIAYADTIFESTSLQKLEAENSDITIAVDTTWENRYQGRDSESLGRAEKVRFDDNKSITEIGSHLSVAESDAEFTGLTRLSPKALSATKELIQLGRLTDTDNLPALIERLSDRLGVVAVDIEGNWAELEEPDDISRFVLDTKANTLRRLSSIIEQSTILDQYTFEVKDWSGNSTDICTDIANEFGVADVIVRSSSLAEDTWRNSNAGRFESVLDVPSENIDAISAAIQQVIDSYPGDNGEDQVLVQPMVPRVSQSGVVMTRSLSTHGPYYVVNYDSETASTESVTDGTGNQLRTAFFRRDVVGDGIPSLNRIQSPSDLNAETLLSAVGEVEDRVNHDSLDIEFATDEDGEVYVLQVRPIVTDPGSESINDESILTAVKHAKQRFETGQPPSSSVLGDRTIYGVMPDWNPAEIIGRQPDLLAESLYRYLITDETWARQRAEFGYRDVRPQPLMTCFAGQPYVDVRAVFNSFIPADLSDELAKKLVEYYLDCLESNPELHDKVEFEIAVTCLPFDFESRAEPLYEAGFSNSELSELRDSLQRITLEAVERVESGQDLEQIDLLESRFEALQEADLSPLRSVRYLLEDCRRLGTLPFAHLARAAFVATSLLRSLERIDVLSEDEVERFLNSISTVARDFERDGHRVSTGELSWEEYVDSYGHLRPGTYDITSPAYAREPETYLRPMVDIESEFEEYPDPDQVWDAETKAEVEIQLGTIGLEPDVNQFISFLTGAIAGREYAKFVFSKNLSLALEQIASYGESCGLSRSQLAHISIDDYFELLTSHPPDPPAKWLKERAEDGYKRSLVTEAVELPPLLFDVADFDCFERPSREPNFVTSETVRAPLVEITAEEAKTKLDGSVVMVPQADPGYDWIFGHNISGLITTYGGANSHMAVRAAEFNIPAAIGVGERLFQQLSEGELVELDCAGRTIERIK